MPSILLPHMPAVFMSVVTDTDSWAQSGRYHSPVFTTFKPDTELNRVVVVFTTFKPDTELNRVVVVFTTFKPDTELNRVVVVFLFSLFFSYKKIKIK